MSKMHHGLAAALALLLAATNLSAREPFRYPEGKFGKGQLSYINGVPVLQVEGTPEEIGEQVTVLAARPSGRLLNYPKDVLEYLGLQATWRPLLRIGEDMVPQFPPSHRREFDAMVRAGLPADLLLAGNTFFDIKRFIACSALIVEPERSATGGPLFGRNLDFLTLGYLQEYSLVTVYRPEGKHAFASIGFPGLIGCLSGMNDQGLCIAVLEVFAASDGSKRFDPSGTPYAMCYRRVLEECSTVAEAERLLRSMKRTCRTNVALCDRQAGVILEVTPDQIVARKPVQGVLPCANHFCSEELRPVFSFNIRSTLDRLEKLEKTGREHARLDFSHIQEALEAVAFADHTLQAMIFEPAELQIYLALGACPAPAQPLRKVELAPLLKRPRQE